MQNQARLSGQWPVYRPNPQAREVKEQLSRLAGALRGVPLFSGLSQRHLRKLARVAIVREYPAESLIVEEGKPGSVFYVLLDGSARVVRGGRTVTQVESNGFFGEISLLDGGPRAASVVAKTTVRCLEMWGKDFMGVLADDATLAMRVLAGMAAWLRAAGGPGVPVDAAQARGRG